MYVFKVDLNADEYHRNVILQALFMLEPFATVPNAINYEIPAAFYGTNASCNIPGADYIAVYDQWQFAKIRTGNNVSNAVKGKGSNFKINERFTYFFSTRNHPQFTGVCIAIYVMLKLIDFIDIRAQFDNYFCDIYVTIIDN